MKKNIKKLNMVLLVAVMTVTQLVGCGSANKKGGDTAETGITAAVGNLDNLNAPGTFPICKEKESFTIMIPQTNIAETWMNQDYEEKTNVHINWISVPRTSWKEKVSVVMAGGDLTDVIAGEDTLNITPINEALYIEQGYLFPLNDLIDQYAPNLKALMEADPSIKKLIAQDDGNIYTLPMIAESYHSNYSQKMYINSQWLENLGLEMPTTLDEYYEVLKAFKEQDANGNGDPNDEIPLITSKEGWHSALDGYLMNAFTYCDADTFFALEDGKLTYTAITSEYQEGVKFLKKLYDEGLLSPESFTNDIQTNTKINVAGETYSAFGSFPSAFQRYVGDTELWREYDIMAPLIREDGTASTPNYSLTRNVISGNFAITSAAKNPELIMQWVDYFYSEEGSMYRLGREGIEWKKAEEGDLNFSGEPAKYKMLKTPEDDPYYGKVIFGQHIPILVSKENRESMAAAENFRDDENNWQDIQLFHGTVAYEAAAPSIEESIPKLNVTGDKSMDYARIKTELEDYQKEALVQFITGIMDIDQDWDAYVNQLKKIGLDEYMSLSNEAYQKYLNK